MTETEKPSLPSATVPPPLRSGPPESKAQRFLRRLARWALVLLITLLAGAALIVFPLYLPLQAQFKGAQTEVAQADQQLSALQTQTSGQISSLATQVAGLQTEKKEAQTALANNEMHLATLNALNDVTAARLALTTEGFNYSNAAFSLTEAMKSLEALAKLAAPEQAKGIKDMQEIATKALSILNGSDPQAAAADLDKLSDSLVTLRRKLLAAP